MRSSAATACGQCVRARVIGDGAPRVSGHIAYRAVLKRAEVPEDLWRPDVVLWAGPKTHFVHYPLRRGELYNLVAVFHSDRYVEGWNSVGDADELWKRFKGERPEVLRLLERIETWRMWVLCDREPVRGWSKGRVTLLGDAAHPMLQYLAQGACMASEDAVWLAEQVAAMPHDIPAAFKPMNSSAICAPAVSRSWRVFTVSSTMPPVLPQSCATRRSMTARRTKAMTAWPGFTARPDRQRGRRRAAATEMPAA